MIVNYYIDTHSFGNRDDKVDRANLELVLSSEGYAFYDATESDPYCVIHTTLEAIEADLECK